MSIVTLAGYLIAAVALGWVLAKRIPDSPAGIDPEYWRRALRYWRHKRGRR